LAAKNDKKRNGGERDDHVARTGNAGESASIGWAPLHQTAGGQSERAKGKRKYSSKKNPPEKKDP